MRRVLSFCIGLFAAFWGGAVACAQDIGAPQTRAQSAPPLRGIITQPNQKAAPTTAAPMTFRVGRRTGGNGCGLDCAEFIYAEGEIRPDSATTFAILWNRLKKRDIPVFIHSPGGSLEGGLDLGRVFRKLGVTIAVGRMRSLDCIAQPAACTGSDRYSGTTVFTELVEKGSCNSACVYAFAGGAARYVSPESQVGVHQFFVARDDDRSRRPKDSYSRKDFGNLQRTVSEVAAYLVEMGVSVNVLTMAADVESSTIRNLTRTELADLNLTTVQNAPLSVPVRTTSEPPAPRPPVRHGARTQSALPFDMNEKAWPMVMRDGQPWLVLSVPSQSRRFGEITNEVAIGCTPDRHRFTALFREIVPANPDTRQDARVVIGPPAPGQRAAIPPATDGAITRETALSAETSGVLVVEVTSSATAGYPMRLEFPGAGLKSGIETLERACKG